MKQAISIFIIHCILSVHALFAGVADPLADLKTQRGFERGDAVYKMALDINGDGKIDMLYSYKIDYDDASSTNQLPPWDIYIADVNDSAYTASTGTDYNDGKGIGPGYVTIDTNHMFVGRITQIGKFGIVTVRTDHPKDLPVSSTIYAYTVENGHIKQTQLSQYTPGQDNAVYNQYLSDAKRTQVQPQLITF